MRCTCCNRSLSDYESTMRHPETLEFLDICTKCLPDTGITPIVRKDLEPEVMEDDLFYEMYTDMRDEEDE